MIVRNFDNEINIIKQIEFLLNTERNYTHSTKDKINILFLRYIMACLNITEINFEYLHINSFTQGRYVKDENTIYLNPKEMKNKNFIKPLTTISHELRHLYQEKSKVPFKKIDIFKKSTYPVNYFNSNTCFLLDLKKIDLYNYYYSSQIEKDARDYSINSLINLCKIIIQDCDKNSFAYTWANNGLKKLQKEKKIEEKKYNYSFNHVKKTYIQLSEIIKYKILGILRIYEYNILQKNDFSLNLAKKNDIKSFLYIYCDDEIVHKIINYCFQSTDIETLFMCLNHPNTKISATQFKECIDFIKMNTAYDNTTIKYNLNIWEKFFLDTYFIDNNLNTNKFVLSKNNLTKFTKMKKLKSFKITFDTNNLLKINNKTKTIENYFEKQ